MSEQGAERNEPESASETEANLIRSAGIDEPKSVEGLRNTDPGSETEAERIRSAGIDEPEG